MKVLYSPHYSKDITPKEPTIFLAGPTLPRGDEGNLTPWRENILSLLDPSLLVYVPEPEPNCQWDWGLKPQIEWEDFHLTIADCILFWVPRDMKTLPGLTTNVEWGRWYNSGKVVLGFPPGAEHMKYIMYYAQQAGVPFSNNLAGAADLAFKMAVSKKSKK